MCSYQSIFLQLCDCNTKQDYFIALLCSTEIQGFVFSYQRGILPWLDHNETLVEMNFFTVQSHHTGIFPSYVNMLSVQSVLTSMCCVLATLHLLAAYPHTAIVRKGNNRYLLRNPLIHLSGTSAVDCAQACLSREDCQGSMLFQDNCVLYKERSACPCPDDAVSLSSESPKMYKLGFSYNPIGAREASQICQNQGMRLLTITSQQEQDLIAAYIDSIRESSYCATSLVVFVTLSQSKWCFA